MDHESAEK